MRANHDRWRVSGLVLFTLYCVFAQSQVAQCEEGATKPDPESAGFPERPKLVLARSQAVEGEQDPIEFWSGRIGALIDAASKTEDTLEKSRNLLGAANIIIARQLETFSSLAVLNLLPELPAGERKSIGDNMDQAEELIGRVKELLAAQAPPDDPAADAPATDQPKGNDPKPDRTQLVHAVEVLQSFLNGQRVYLLGETEPGARRRAASALAPLLEDSDRKVAAAARLWQALLRGLEPDPAAAIQILDSPMAPPHPETWPYGLFSKVLRCRYQGAQGSWSPALVMLVHIEEQLESWVPDLALRGDARRFFAYTRLEVLKRWYDSLPPERTTERAWCVLQAGEILKSYFAVETSLLRLNPAVPMVFSDDVYKTGGQKADPQ